MAISQQALRMLMHKTDLALWRRSTQSYSSSSCSRPSVSQWQLQTLILPIGYSSTGGCGYLASFLYFLQRFSCSVSSLSEGRSQSTTFYSFCLRWAKLTWSRQYAWAIPFKSTALWLHVTTTSLTANQSYVPPLVQLPSLLLALPMHVPLRPTSLLNGGSFSLQEWRSASLACLVFSSAMQSSRWLLLALAFSCSEYTWFLTLS